MKNRKLKRKRKQKRKRGSLREGREAPPRRCPHPFRFCFRFRFNFRFLNFYFIRVRINIQSPSAGLGAFFSIRFRTRFVSMLKRFCEVFGAQNVTGNRFLDFFGCFFSIAILAAILSDFWLSMQVLSENADIADSFEDERS